MRTIELTQGKQAIVDDEDYSLVSNYGKWRFDGGYARKLLQENLTRRYVYLHNVIMKPPLGFEVDHIDKNGLNCQRNNMRLATDSQNCVNRTYRMQHGFRGIELLPNQTWRAAIRLNGKLYRSTVCQTKEQAAKEYDKLAKQYHGNFAVLNFPE